ncbi:MAG: radical SAM protein [Candidatus Margulisbacteria bacterium]|nr:radical SAM protein [Candidatus Margulisiibacteriota bacterium]
MNILFLHISEHTNNKFRTNLVPCGMFGLADYISNSGANVKIIHKELEELLNPGFSITEHIAKNKYRIVCMDLNYHTQAFSVIKYAQLIKHSFTDTYICLGGMTASLYANEILENFPELDFIIRGDSEEPLLRLITALKNKQSPVLIKGISYRQGKRIFNNELAGSIKPDILNNISFSNYSLLAHYDEYLRLRMGTPILYKERQAYYSAGRNCNKNCSFCGASVDVKKKLSVNGATLWKSIPSVLNDFKKFKEYQISSWNTCWDPPDNHEYYLELFNKIRKNNIYLKLVFDCFDLPHTEFIRAVRQTFISGSVLTLSPNSGSQQVRVNNKLSKYSNEKIFETCDLIAKNSLLCSIYFSAGFAGEKISDTKKTIKLIQQIKNKFPNFRIIAEMIEPEPFANALMSDNDGDLTGFPKTFMDYYQLHKDGKELSYGTKYFKFEEIKEIIGEYNTYASN